MVYVISNQNIALMPTNRYAKVRILLKNKLAKVVNTKPFTIKLLYNTENYTQPLTMGIDSGYLNIGFSVINNNKEFISGEVKLLQGMKKRLKEKSQYRRTRRNRLRYRKPRFNNRIKSKKEGWLAPSIQHKLDSHIRFIEKLRKILPITTINIEVANFDIQKLKDPNIEGIAYQQGEQKDFYNLREYILHRDNHKCQNPNCTNKAEKPILQLHHIIFKDNGGTDMPNNLITLCTKCHTSANHKKGKFLYDWQTKGKEAKGYKDSTFMSIVRWRLIDYLKQLDIETNATYGYITKSKRIELGVEKTHYNDAFVIANGSKQERIEPIEYNQIRRNNRCLEKFYDKKIIDIRIKDKKNKKRKTSGSILNNGRRTRNKNLNTFNLRIYRGEMLSKGKRTIRTQRYNYQPKDIVLWKGIKYVVKGTHNKGARVIIILKDNTEKSINVKEIRPYKYNNGLCVI